MLVGSNPTCTTGAQFLLFPVLESVEGEQRQTDYKIIGGELETFFMVVGVITCAFLVMYPLFNLGFYFLNKWLKLDD